MKTRKLCILMVMIAGLMAGCASPYHATTPPRTQSINVYRPDGTRSDYGYIGR